jgi:hypothetical protein
MGDIMRKYTVFALGFICGILAVIAAHAQEVTMPDDMDEQMQEVIVKEYCDQPPPDERPAIAYVWQDGRCVPVVWR